MVRAKPKVVKDGRKRPPRTDECAQCGAKLLRTSRLYCVCPNGHGGLRLFRSVSMIDRAGVRDPGCFMSAKDSDDEGVL